MIRFFQHLYNFARIIIQPLINLVIRYRANDYHRRRAVKRAINLNKKTGKRYRVAFHWGKYRVYHRDDLKDFKQSGFFGRLMNVTRLEEGGIILFDTNTLHPCHS